MLKGIKVESKVLDTPPPECAPTVVDSSSEGEAVIVEESFITTAFVVIKKNEFAERIPITRAPATATLEDLYVSAKKGTKGKCDFFGDNGWPLPRSMSVGDLSTEDREAGIRVRRRIDAPNDMRTIMVTGMKHQRKLYMYDTA